MQEKLENTFSTALLLLKVRAKYICLLNCQLKIVFLKNISSYWLALQLKWEKIFKKDLVCPFYVLFEEGFSLIKNWPNLFNVHISIQYLKGDNFFLKSVFLLFPPVINRCFTWLLLFCRSTMVALMLYARKERRQNRAFQFGTDTSSNFSCIFLNPNYFVKFEW